MRYVWYIVLACTLFPGIVRATVVVNEIAWMGTTASANDEWIELFNDGTDEVDLSGWVLSASDGEPKILLSGYILGGGFFLLERTDDSSAPGAPADIIYSGNMSNTGETLTLKDASSTVIDTVAGGADWKNTGGDNTTKHTAQRQDDATWITGVPTPGAINSTENTKSEGSSSGGGTSSGKITNPMLPKVSGGYRQKVFAYAGQDAIGVVGADVEFTGLAVNEKNEGLYHPVMEWTFGDGTRRVGEHLTHVYQQPGSYTAVLHVSSGDQEAEDTRAVYIVEPDVRIARVAWGEGGFVEVRNDSVYELDISHWNLLARRKETEKRLKQFSFPENTRVAPFSSVRFSEYVTRLGMKEGDKVTLLFPNEAEVSTFVATPDVSLPKPPPVIEDPAPVAPTLQEEAQEPPDNFTKGYAPVSQGEDATSTDIKATSSISLASSTYSGTTSAIVLGAVATPRSSRNTRLLWSILGATVLLLGVFILWRPGTVLRGSGATLSFGGETIRPEDISITDVTPKEH